MIVRMYTDEGKHNVPHIHVQCGSKEAVFSLKGNLLEGSLPPNKRKILLAWITIHQEELETNWLLLSEGSQIVKIDPLK
jgi:hypothetical protein